MKYQIENPRKTSELGNTALSFLENIAMAGLAAVVIATPILVGHELAKQANARTQPYAQQTLYQDK